MKKHKNYYTCPICGANLDPGEDCEYCKSHGNISNMTFIYPKSCDKTHKKHYDDNQIIDNKI